MKKLLTILLAAAVMICTPMSIFADDFNEVAQDDLTTPDVILKANASSKYTVKLPKEVNVSANEKTFKVYAYGDLDGAYEISVQPGEGEHALKDDAGVKDDVALTISADKTLTIEEIGTEDYNDSCITFTVEHADLLAGSYTYSLPIVISLVDAN